MRPYALIHVRRPREHSRRLPGDIGQPDEEPAGKALRAGTAPLARQGAGRRHRTGGPLQDPDPPKTRDAGRRHARGRRRPRNPRKRPRTRKGCRQTRMGLSAAFLLRENAGNARKRKRGTHTGPPLPGAHVAPPRPLPAQRAPGAGGALLSHRVAPAVPSALAGLTSGFGMGPGVPRPPWPPAPGGRCGAGCAGAGGAPGRPGGRTALGEVTLLRTVGGGGTFICVPKGSAD